MLLHWAPTPQARQGPWESQEPAQEPEESPLPGSPSPAPASSDTTASRKSSVTLWLGQAAPASGSHPRPLCYPITCLTRGQKTPGSVRVWLLRQPGGTVTLLRPHLSV